MNVQIAEAAYSHPPTRHQSALPATLRRLVLTGFMGAGKTTVGRLLAQRLGWDFLDLDAHIERRAGLSVPAIFAAHGEAHFRRLESTALVSALGSEQSGAGAGRRHSRDPHQPAAAGADPRNRHRLSRRAVLHRSSTAACCRPSTLALLPDRRTPPPTARRPRSRGGPLPRPPADLPPPRARHGRNRRAHARADGRLRSRVPLGTASSSIQR